MDSIKTRRPRRTQGKRHGRLRTPTVLQMEAVECGAAALGIILGYYGRHVPLAELRRECGVSRDGSNAANVLIAARRYGLTATGCTMEVETLEGLPYPAMIFWNFDHFLVVEGFRRGRVYLNDPASGPCSVSREEFGQSFTGIVLVMAPGPDFTPGGQQPSTLHALRTRLWGTGGTLAYCVLAGFFLVVSGLAVPVLTQVFVDQILIAGLHDCRRVGFLCPLGRVLYQGEQCPADVARDPPDARCSPHLLQRPGDHARLAPVTNLVGFASTLQDLQGALHRLDDVLHNPALPARVQTLCPATLTTTDWHGSVQVRNLTFGYSQVSPPTLENISLTLQPGQRVALVGASGSGKSTLARLVCGLYEPWQGEILFDGVPRVQIPSQVLSQAVTMVDQDIVLFAGSVRENLTLWDSTVPDEHLIRACKDAALHEVILALPGGYDGALLEGAANLSGGQRQRLELARALVHDPVLLVLDEATSALDAVTEYQIMERLRQRHCACLVVAHRLSTLRACDEIIVLEQGKVVQQGTHATLLRQSGVYARLLRDADVAAGALGAGMEGSI